MLPAINELTVPVWIVTNTLDSTVLFQSFRASEARSYASIYESRQPGNQATVHAGKATIEFDYAGRVADSVE